ncbi:allophanate hydrolase [Glycomyces sp. NPDC046736]|uniref:allophanate hydrolase n=1 Tax=Glycomyces sp. NPDC046736 TaxID=3155615 RepID=UPI003403AAF5
MNEARSTVSAASIRTRVEAAYARIAEVARPEIWIALRDKTHVLAEAGRTDPSLPLAGLLFAVKDNIDLGPSPEGERFATTAACPSYAYTPESSASAVVRLQEAGAICIGKTNLDQFATGLVGTRSPYGAVRSAADPDLISGGSSSGSAVAVALGIVDFALGTDTAGSGRVPAALGGIVGLKATLGVIPVDGVVPASPSYDCLTVFAPDLALAAETMRVMSPPTSADPAWRPWPAHLHLAAPPRPRLAVPIEANLAALDPDFTPLWTKALEAFAAAGADLVPFDARPLLDAALLLYEGALLAERYAAFGAHLDTLPADADPTVAAIVRAAGKFSGADLAFDQQRLRAARTKAAALLADFDALVLPTAPRHPTIAEVGADPIGLNALMGTYTNFVNLLDMAAVAVPAGRAGTKHFGVSVITPAFADQVAIDLAARYLGVPAPLFAPADTELVVFGAHMKGMPLNRQLTDLGARYDGEITTAAAYRMYALDTTVPKPFLVRDERGTNLPGERWLLSRAALGTFLHALPAPMTLGPLELADGTWTTGFTANTPTGVDITEEGGWRAHVG